MNYPVSFWGLGDRTAPLDYHRAHEFGHLVDNAAWKRGFRLDNPVPDNYTYAGKTMQTAVPGSHYSPERIAKEYNADVFGNAISSDAHLDARPMMSRLRYPFFSQDYPVFGRAWNNYKISKF